MQAVTGELGRRDVIAKVTGLLDLDEQAFYQVNQLLFYQCDLLPPMQERPELSAVLLGMHSAVFRVPTTTAATKGLTRGR